MDADKVAEQAVAYRMLGAQLRQDAEAFQLVVGEVRRIANWLVTAKTSGNLPDDWQKVTSAFWRMDHIPSQLVAGEPVWGGIRIFLSRRGVFKREGATRDFSRQFVQSVMQRMYALIVGDMDDMVALDNAKRRAYERLHYKRERRSNVVERPSMGRSTGQGRTTMLPRR